MLERASLVLSLPALLVAVRGPTPWPSTGADDVSAARPPPSGR
jgi:hypothetical protein